MHNNESKEIQNALNKLRQYVETENYQGYDPYDGLNSKIPFEKIGKWPPILLMQLLKRLPFNTRPLLGIKKGINPKAIGLFLHAYSLQYKRYPDEKIRVQMDYLFNWLIDNYSKGYSGYSWGYNFDWAGEAKMVKAYTPTAVVTGFVCRGIYQYYLVTKNEKAREVLLSAAEFAEKDLLHDYTQHGLCFSYTTFIQDYCFNASLLAAEVLAIANKLKPNKHYAEMVQSAIDFVLHFQKPSGVWNYSVNLETGNERTQIDFHQGYVLESISRLSALLGSSDKKYQDALSRGLTFYKNEQFFESGQSKWRIPKNWPVEIHNQAQGIITFTLFAEHDASFLPFAHKIADWTILHMQSKKSGYFYYRIYKSHVNKIPFMRWSQAWMFLAISTLLYNYEK